MKRLHLISFLCALLTAAVAHAGNNGQGQGQGQSKTPPGLDTTGNDTAISKSEAGDYDAAATAASTYNTAAKGTFAWYEQSAIQLIEYTSFLKGKSDDANAKRAAAAALKVLEGALKDKGGRASERGQAYADAGVLCEDLLKDRKNATKYFKAALKEDPNNFEAQHMLARYDAEAATLQRFIDAGH
jgi:hypothetical protein